MTTTRMTEVMTANMTSDRLTEIIAAYGAAPARWPEAERAAAQALLARSLATGAPAERARLQAALDEAAALDGVLAGFAPPLPEAALARVTAAVAFPPRPARRERSFGLFALAHMIFKPAGAVGATMAVLGLFVGLSVDPAYSNGDGSDYTVSQNADAAFAAFGQDNGDAAP
jgi:hypothetical protein